MAWCPTLEGELAGLTSLVNRKMIATYKIMSEKDRDRVDPRVLFDLAVEGEGP